MDREMKVISASVFAFSFTTAVINLSSGLRVYSLSKSASLLSLATLVYNVFYTLASYYYGKISYHRLSQVDLIFSSFLAIGASSILMGTLNDPYAVVAMNAIFGFGAALGSPTLTAVLANHLMKDNIAVTRYNILVSLGTIFGYLTASFLGQLPLSYILIIMGAILLSFAPLAFMLPPKFRAKMRERVTIAPMLSHLVGKMRSLPSDMAHWEKLLSFGEVGREMRKMLRVRIARSSTLTLLGIVTLFTAINVFFTPMPAYLRMAGYSDNEIYAIYMLSNFTTLLLYDFVKERIGNSEQTWRVLLFSVSIRPALFLLPFTLDLLSPKLVFPLLYIFVGATWAGISASLPVIMMRHAAPEKKGEALSKMNAMTSLGAIIGSFVASILSIWGISYTSAVASVTVLVALLIFREASRASID
ncbi:MAG: MFS transporter [Thermoprotei archaeon]|nr:MFS transporter [Thermoprotei archaeon]